MERLAVDIETAAKMTSLSPHTIRKYIRKGNRIRVVRFGRRVLVPVIELQRLINEGLDGAVQDTRLGEDNE